jgi:anti-anti-sigma factor
MVDHRTMDIRARTIGSVTVLDLVGRMVLDDEETARQVVTQIADSLATGARQVVVNLAGVTQIDTSGLTALVRAHLAVIRRGGRIKLAAPGARIREVLRTTGLNRLFEVLDTEQEALDAFAREMRART